MANKTFFKNILADTHEKFYEKVKETHLAINVKVRKDWYDETYKYLSKKYTKKGSRLKWEGQVYPFLRTQQLRESLRYSVTEPKYSKSLDSYKAKFSVIGKLGPSYNKKNRYEYSNLLNKSETLKVFGRTIPNPVKGYKTHSFFMLEKTIERVINGI